MPPIVRLAGYNVDAELLSETLDILRELDQLSKSMGVNPSASDLRAAVERLGDELRARIDFEAFTPETISAAYARISRDPSHVTELRRSARFSVARARKSNENIIFGLGHASVAEHATFNFDVSHLSRLATEELQYHRLQSFTEKSQRYITFGEEYIVPPELVGTDVESKFRDVVRKLFATYTTILETLTESSLPDDPGALSKAELRDLENRAKEDARYLLPLACSTQMGMTLNARNLEHLLWELSDHPLTEVRELGQAIHAAVGKMAPSLVKYTSRREYPRANRLALRAQFAGKPAPESALSFRNAPRAELLDFDRDAEHRVLEAFSFSSNGTMTKADEAKLWRLIFTNLGPHDPVYREFEVARATLALEMSATCYAQFKRHRLMTQLVQSYAPQFAAIVPPAIEDIGQADVFRAAVRDAAEAAQEIAKSSPGLEAYVLTNAHVKRVMVSLNARELYHLCRLRCDAHAQWEIQLLAGKMLELLQSKWPNLLALACGKDKYDEVAAQFFV
ncbi:MAG: FAD-dependent thymidylate synthase [bacterium]|nr:FAD-dependent thymidylate synthase [bacterium]